MQNPYKQKPQELKRVSCDISEAHWKRLKQLVPEQGIQDIILSRLFFNFFSELSSLQLKTPNTPDEFTAIKKQLCRLVLRYPDTPAPGHGTN